MYEYLEYYAIKIPPHSISEMIINHALLPGLRQGGFAPFSYVVKTSTTFFFESG